MKVFLDVDKGPRVGERFELSANVCRAIGRLEAATNSETLIVGGDRPLDPEDQALIAAHLERRSGAARARSARAEPRSGAFRRGSDILLEDELTSRTHAMVFLDESGLSLVDLGSTNGTFVNAKPVTDADLVDGDVVHIGRARFIVRIESG